MGSIPSRIFASLRRQVPSVINHSAASAALTTGVHSIGDNFALDSKEGALRALHQKINQPTITPEDFNALLAGFSRTDRPYAEEILRQSAQNANYDSTVRQLKAIGEQADLDGQMGMGGHFLYLDAAEAGPTLAYWIQKNRLCLGMYMTPKEAFEPAVIDSSTFLVGSIGNRRLSQEELTLLAQVKNLQILDIPYFERGPNFLDFAVPDALKTVREKMQSLIEEAKQATSGKKLFRSQKQIEEASSQALEGPLHQNLANLNALRAEQGLSEAYLYGSRPERLSGSLDDVAAHYASTPFTKEALQQYAENLSPAELKLLADPDGFQFFPPKRVMEGMQQIGRQIRAAVPDPSQVYFVVDPSTGGKSTGMMTYMFQKTSGFSPRQFVSQEKLERMTQAGQIGKGQSLVFLDDLNGTGNSLAANISHLPEAGTRCGKIFACHLVDYQAARQAVRQRFSELSLHNEAIEISPDKIHFISPKLPITGLGNAKHPYVESLSDAERKQFKDAFSSWRSYKNTHGTEVFFYSTPDNATEPVGLFALDFLGLNSNKSALPYY